MAIADIRTAWQLGSMDRTEEAIAIAREYLSEHLSPFEAASRMQGIGVSSLPCWASTGGPHGPLSSSYGAADVADDWHFLGDDVEQWHDHVREQKRTEPATAEERWRGRIETACRMLIEYAVSH